MVMEVDLCRFRCLWSLFIHCSVDFGDEVLSEDVNVWIEGEDEREYFIEVRWTIDLSGREVRGGCGRAGFCFPAYVLAFN